MYDATTFPTFVGSLARAYYFMTAKLSPEERRHRKALFGTFREVLRPIRPYRWRTEGGELIEIPVTTMPLFSVPIHVSYLHLNAFAPALALHYFRAALRLCRLTGTQPSLLLHPLDFLGWNDTHDLSFFPAMGLPTEKKLAMVSEMFWLLSDQFTVLTVQQYVQEVARGPNLSLVEPRFWHRMYSVETRR